MRVQRSRRRPQGAQAAIEMAEVFPIMIVIVLGFVATMLQLRAADELQTAVNLAAQASVVPPLGDPAASQLDAQYAFSSTLDPAGSEAGFLVVSSPLRCSGPYLTGQVSAVPITCTADARINWSHTPVGLLVFWQPTIRVVSAVAFAPDYRRCAAPMPANAADPSQC